MRIALTSACLIILVLMSSCTKEPKDQHGISFTYNGETHTTHNYLLTSFKEGLACVNVDGKYGYIDEEHKVVIEPVFDSAFAFNDGLARVRLGEKWGFINKTGEIEIEPLFDSASLFNGGLSLVSLNEKYGFINKAGEVVIAPEYDKANQFKSGPGSLARVSVNGKYGFINKTGESITPIHFDWAEEFNPSYTRVMIERDFFYIDRNGEKYYQNIEISNLIQAQDKMQIDNFPKPFQPPLALRSGFVDSDKNYVIDTLFDQVWNFSCGWARVRIDPGTGMYDSTYTYVDPTGKVLMAPILKDAKSFSGDLAAVRFDSLWGYIDTSGQTVIEPIFKSAGSFADGIANVTINDTCGYINRTGEFVIEPKFAKLGEFHEGLAVATLDKYPGQNYGYINKTGEYVISPVFYGARDFHEGFAVIANESGKLGYIDRTGKVVIKPQYLSASFFFEGKAIVSFDKSLQKSCLYIDMQGNECSIPDQGWFLRRNEWLSLKDR